MTTHDELYGQALLRAVGYNPNTDGEIKQHTIPVEKLNGLRNFGIAEPITIGHYVQGSGDKKTITFLPKCTSDLKIVGEGSTLEEAVNVLLPQIQQNAWLVKLHLGHYNKSTFSTK